MPYRMLELASLLALSRSEPWASVAPEMTMPYAAELLGSVGTSVISLPVTRHCWEENTEMPLRVVRLTWLRETITFEHRSMRMPSRTAPSTMLSETMRPTQWLASMPV